MGMNRKAIKVSVVLGLITFVALTATVVVASGRSLPDTRPAAGEHK